MTTRRTLRLALVSAAPTPALRAARFPDDEGLDADGLRRTAAAARTLAAGPLAAGALPGRARVLIDDSARARQTARVLGLSARAGETGVRVETALRDLDVGDWRGRELSEIPSADLLRWHEEPTMAPPGGESRQALVTRVSTWLDGLAGEAEHVIAVSHPAIVRAVLLTVLRCPPEVFWRIDVAPLTATLLHRRASLPDAAGAADAAVHWTLTHACRPL
ncbi:histidine phosphatase family protein [Frankia sp. AgPm24]|uniref:histidine phosphatase family protein n=1 Tax=Frankia sp. AgPm24 TaxID=631128 RepID=UPI002010B9B7|nr:histidine phosphatase family protein [Frankia sp. AgPm24]MCK9923063.1 histidine phosphatase family protein [Frankia sp. AgPm24]